MLQAQGAPARVSPETLLQQLGHTLGLQRALGSSGNTGSSGANVTSTSSNSSADAIAGPQTDPDGANAAVGDMTTPLGAAVRCAVNGADSNSGSSGNNGQDVAAGALRCFSAPESWQLGWAQPLATLDNSTLLEGERLIVMSFLFSPGYPPCCVPQCLPTFSSLAADAPASECRSAAAPLPPCTHPLICHEAPPLPCFAALYQGMPAADASLLSLHVSAGQLLRFSLPPLAAAMNSFIRVLPSWSPAQGTASSSPLFISHR